MPHQTSLRYFNSHICGAAIISARHCLTAAHCFEEGTLLSYYSILAGSTSVSGRDDTAAHVSVQNIILHPHYDDKLNINDIAVLVLERPLPINGRTIAIARLPAQNSPVPHGSVGVVSGWLVMK